MLTFLEGGIVKTISGCPSEFFSAPNALSFARAFPRAFATGFFFGFGATLMNFAGGDINAQSDPGDKDPSAPPSTVVASSSTIDDERT